VQSKKLFNHAGESDDINADDEFPSPDVLREAINRDHLANFAKKPVKADSQIHLFAESCWLHKLRKTIYRSLVYCPSNSPLKSM
jgi:hypothetical protein